MAKQEEVSMPQKDGRPLVTYALFSYNQEKYVREAVEGAFAQTYEPLEIILSDDCSTDKSFEIMKEMAVKYTGKHRVIVRQNDRNQGLISHINRVLDGASGEFFVLAAGDDISLTNRVERVVECFNTSEELMLIHSQVTLIDEEGSEQGLHEPPITNANSNPLALALAGAIYIGATGALRKRVYSNFGPIAETETYEDLVFGFRAALIGKIHFLAEPLVKYRPNIGISSRFGRWAGSRRSKQVGLIRLRLATLRQRLQDLDIMNHPYHRSLAKKIGRGYAIDQARLEIHTDPLLFLRNLSSTGIYCSIRAIISELKFVCRVMLK